MAPTVTKQWTVSGTSGFDCLKYDERAQVPKLGDHDVLVHMQYASLNYRDLIIPKGKYPFGTEDNVVPGSDGAGTVHETGSRVKSLQKGDKVMTLFTQDHQAGPIRPAYQSTSLGGTTNGVLREYAVFEEKGLLVVPNGLSLQEASTLPCAALTAWNALYGLEGRALMPGDWVLTQGTGGVSLFALQFAKAVGAHVISTTSSDSKAATLRSLGAEHVINYKTDENWGETARKLTPGGEGVQHIIEVGGPKTMTQSFRAVRFEGVITIVGFLGGVKGEKQPSTLDCLNNICTLRGVLVGSRTQCEAMNRAIEAAGIKPVLDKKVFDLADLKDAYQYMWDQKHFGKLTVKIGGDSNGSKL